MSKPGRQAPTTSHIFGALATTVHKSELKCQKVGERIYRGKRRGLNAETPVDTRDAGEEKDERARGRETYEVQLQNCDAKHNSPKEV